MNQELKQDVNNEFLVVARLNKDKLAFSMPSTFDELYQACSKALPADIVYFVVEGPDGFAFREAGRLVLQFVPTEALAVQPTPVAPPQLSPVVEVVPPVVPQDAPERIVVVEPIPEPTPTPKKRVKRAPRPLPGKGSMGIDGFIPATAAQAEAASCFGKISTN